MFFNNADKCSLLSVKIIVLKKISIPYKNKIGM